MSEPPEGYYDEPVPTWVKPCQECGTDVERYHGESDVTCGKCGAQYNAFGQCLSAERSPLIIQNPVRRESGW
jgi:hypothetical protein